MKVDGERFLDKGFDSYVSRFVKIEEFLNAVKSYFNSGSLIPDSLNPFDLNMQLSHLPQGT